MSEEILEHLMKLFGIIAKQGGGASDIEVEFVSKFLKSQLGDAAVEQYLDMFKSEANKGVKFDDRGRLIVAVGDSMKVLGICRKANKALTKEQKVVVLVRLYEMEKVYTDGINAGTVKVSLSTYEGNDMAAETIKLREEVIKTAGEVFNLEVKEIDNIKLFCNQSDPTQFDQDDFLVADEKEEERAVPSEPLA